MFSINIFSDEDQKQVSVNIQGPGNSCLDTQGVFY